MRLLIQTLMYCSKFGDWRKSSCNDSTAVLMRPDPADNRPVEFPEVYATWAST